MDDADNAAKAETDTALATGLDAFIATRPDAHAWLDVFDRQRSTGAGTTAMKLVGGVINEVMSHEGDDGGHSKAAREVALTWTSSNATGAEVVVPVPRSVDVVAATLRIAKPLAIPVTWRYRHQGLVGTTETIDRFFTPRVLPDPGKLGPSCSVSEDDAHLEISLTELDEPGALSRRLLRRETMTKSYTVRIDSHGLRVTHTTRSGTDAVHASLNDYVAVLMRSGPTSSRQRKSLLVTPTEALGLPRVEGSAWDAFELETWMWARVNQPDEGLVSSTYGCSEPDADATPTTGWIRFTSSRSASSAPCAPWSCTPIGVVEPNRGIAPTVDR